MIGQMLGPYLVLSKLGEGGMGEVYKARDTRLDRTVAIKVLPEHVAADPSSRERLEREARAISSLNHPHICTLHDVGREGDRAFLVMEHLEGETLSTRLQRGAVSVDQAVTIAIAIANALDAAHRHGLVHRDLKPANIFLVRGGSGSTAPVAKLLDFGLAKSVTPVPAAAMSLTAAPVTAAGMLLGTFPYMAPEQIEGRDDVDARADIWAFGCVLYEMLASRRAFDAPTQATLISAVMSAEPPRLRQVQPLVPASLEHLVERCLSKDAADRWQSMHDIRLALEWFRAHGEPVAQARAQQPRRRREAALIAWAIASTLMVAVLAWRGAAPPVTHDSINRRLSLELPAGQRLIGNAPMAFSPDSTMLIYAAETRSGSSSDPRRSSQLWLRRLDRFDATPLASTGGAQDPFFSPDGTWVGYFTSSELRKVPIDGGTSLAICSIPGILPMGAAWRDDDSIVFAPDIASGLMIVPASGGTPSTLTGPAADRGEIGLGWPQVLPGGALLFSVLDEHKWNLAVLAPGERQWRVLQEIDSATGARYLPTGHLVYTQAGNLVATPFDLDRLQPAGSVVPIIDGLYGTLFAGKFAGYFAVAPNGSLAYAPGALAKNALVWVDRSGRTEAVLPERSVYDYPRLSPDGQRLAVTEMAQTAVYDLRRGTGTRLTTGGLNYVSAWNADGRRVIFGSYRSGSVDLFSAPADGSSEPKLLLARPHRQYPGASTADGKVVFFEATPEGSGDIGVLTLENPASASTLLATRFDERNPRLSRDGHWLAYTSNESGRDEVYARRFPTLDAKVPISNGGGDEPVWSADGRELFFRRANQMVVVDVVLGAEIRVGTPKVLFDRPRSTATLSCCGANYDVTPDGKRFVMLQDDAAAEANRVYLVLDWFDELRRKVPGRP